MLQRSRQSTWWGAVGVALVLLCALPVVGQVTNPGRQGTMIPERTDAGEWYGTWYYVQRDFKMAMWIRMEDGSPQVMVPRQRLLTEMSLRPRRR